MDGYAQRFIYPLISLDYYQALIYVVVFSITGVLAVGRKDVDLFGVVMLGLITALGGGTIRDILLNIRVFWVQDFSHNTSGKAGGSELIDPSKGPELIWTVSLKVPIFPVISSAITPTKAGLQGR